VQFNLDAVRDLKLDAVFISHFHDDHCSLESLNLLDRQTPIYIYCLYDEIPNLIRQLGFETVVQLKINSAVDIGNFKIIPRRALDSDVDSLLQVRAAGLNVLNVVDSWIDSSTMNLLAGEGPWDLIMWPFQTMRELEVISPRWAAKTETTLPPEWLEQLKILNPKYLIPSSCQFVQESWSWYNNWLFPISYKQFQQELGEVLPETEVIKLNPSQALALDKDSVTKAEPLKWILPIGNQDLDYVFEKHLQPPSTAEIARKFPALTERQLSEVRSFCTTEILQRYNGLDAPEDPYFQKDIFWRLTLYDHQGISTKYLYRIVANQMQSIESAATISWSTEVPLYKLHRALKSGESLTSMYLRINDEKLDAEVENRIQTVDIMDDPLIRCLFQGEVGTYQKAQLKKLLAKADSVGGMSPAP
jgi:hypothetical protein